MLIFLLRAVFPFAFIPLFFGSERLLWWEKLDLNQRSLAATNLQSAPFDQTQAFSHVWWALQESNLGRADLQSAALPTELRTRGVRGRLRTGALQGHNLPL